jgi:integrase
MVTELKKFRASLKKINHMHKIKIRIRKNTSGLYSIFLDKWENGKHKYEFLDFTLNLIRTTSQSDAEKLLGIRNYRDKLEILRNNDNEPNPGRYESANFIRIFNALAEEKNEGNKKKWISTIKHLETFAGDVLLIKEITPSFCFKFFNYLKSNNSRSTPKIYYKVFSAALNYLVNEQKLHVNPARIAAQRSDFKTIARTLNEKEREFLTRSEIKKLLKLKTEYLNIKNAFIVSCFTGLRLGDIRSLKSQHIQEDHIVIEQNKTSEVVHIPIHDTISQLLSIKAKSTSPRTNLFNLPDTKIINKRIGQMLSSLEINKHITFHCARHTFATLCLSSDVDIYTVSQLLGHKDLKTTQIYAKIIDTKRSAAIKKLIL